MSSRTTLGLLPDDVSPAVVSPGRPTVTRGDLASGAQALAERLRTSGISRMLVCSDDPYHIVRAVEAAALASVDLWVAHTSLPAGMVDEIIASASVQLKIDDAGDHDVSGAGALDGATGRIHMMTSGTTGRPKIAEHSLESLAARAARQSGHAANQNGRWLLTYQPTGFAGLQVILTAMLSDGTLVVPRERTPAGFLEATAAFDVTQISATPTFWRAFLMVVPRSGLPLKQITLGGEGVDQVTLDRLVRAFPSARVTHIYASTEAGVVFAVHDGREGFPAAWLDTRNHQGTELAVRDGVLHIRTPHAMKRYVNETAQPLLEDGWLATADRCEIVGDRVRLLGRQDATINVGGSKVYPLAVETFLLGLPGVSEARVFGVANPITGFLVAADVVLAPDQVPDEARGRILAACREGLASYQVPRVMKFVTAIDVHESGKKG